MPTTTEKPTAATAPTTDAAQVLTAAQRSAAREARVAQAFSQIVAVLMRDPAWRHLSLAELEWLVLPPLLAGQFRVAHAAAAKENAAPSSGMMAPVALAIWARVSPAVDARLATQQAQGQPARLLPSEWTSGDIPWLVVTAGHPRALPEFVKQLLQVEFKDRPPKLLQRVAVRNAAPARPAAASPSSQGAGTSLKDAG